jgi:hypothetical protein
LGQDVDGRQGKFVMTDMEDNGTATALKRLERAKKVDFRRVLFLRTASNYCMPAPQQGAAGVCCMNTREGFRRSSRRIRWEAPSCIESWAIGPNGRRKFPVSKSNMTRITICLFIATAAARAGSFDQQFETIKKTANKSQLYALLWDVPKGGDLHNHFGLSNMAEQWYDAATNKKRTNGNEFYTRTMINNCPDSVEPLLRFRTIQRSNYLEHVRLPESGVPESGHAHRRS